MDKGNNSAKRGRGQKRKHQEVEEEPAVDEDAPTSINLGDYVENRAQEINALMKALKTRTGPRTALQLLPKHMRRRAASHNIKRLPRRVREMARKMMESQGKLSQTKRPSRRHRRRPKNLLEEYTRRARKNCWLETHIWHAKRFKMANLWGYRVPLHPCDKGVRPAYRAMAKCCLLQDISYYVCLEIEGPEADIIQGMNKLCSSATGPTFAAKACLGGEREGRLMLYKADAYPHGPLCPATFLWKPPGFSMDTDVTDNKVKHDEHSGPYRTLWITVHPASYKLVLEEVANVFGLVQKDSAGKNIPVEESVHGESNVTAVSSEKQSSISDDGKGSLATGNEEVKEDKGTVAGSNFDAKPKENNENVDLNMLNPEFSNGRIHVRSLKDKLCRFRLTGPLSQAVLKDTCQLSRVNKDNNNRHDSGAEVREETKPCEDSYWWEGLYSKEKYAALYQGQGAVWDRVTQCASPAELPARMVLGLTVRDPRLLLPPQKIKATISSEVGSEAVITVVPPDVSYSPLWEQDTRCKVKDTKITEAKLNELRSRNLVPGSTIDLGREESRVPLVLVQQPGNRASPNESPTTPPAGHGAGWDLLLPAGWAMPFWIAMVYRGARAAGLRELQAHSREQGRLHFPDDYPDTPAGEEFSTMQREELQAIYNRKPPAKRPNYIKYGHNTPFSCPWKCLIDHWKKQTGIGDIHGQNTGSQIYVLRDKTILKKLSKIVNSRTEQSRKHNTMQTPSDIAGDLEFLKQVVNQHSCSVVAVQLDMVQRGTPLHCASIALPTKEDVVKLHQDKSYGGPVEPSHPDPRPKITKQKKRKKKKKSKDNSVDNTPSEQTNTGSSGSNEGEKTVSTISDIDTINSNVTREILGFVNHGNFSFTAAHGVGVGFVCLSGLQNLLKSHERPYVLIRNTTTFQYRFAKVSIVTDL